MTNQDEQLQQIADYIETVRQAEAKWTPQELAALQRMADEALFPPPPIDSSSIEAITALQASYADSRTRLEQAQVASSLLDHSFGGSLRRNAGTRGLGYGTCGCSNACDGKPLSEHAD